MRYNFHVHFCPTFAAAGLDFMVVYPPVLLGFEREEKA